VSVPEAEATAGREDVRLLPLGNHDGVPDDVWPSKNSKGDNTDALVQLLDDFVYFEAGEPQFLSRAFLSKVLATPS